MRELTELHFPQAETKAPSVWGEEIDTPATAVWLVGVYSHDGRDYSHCEQIVELDAAIARAVEMLVSPQQHFRKWPRATVIE